MNSSVFNSQGIINETDAKYLKLNATSQTISGSVSVNSLIVQGTTTTNGSVFLPASAVLGIGTTSTTSAINLNLSSLSSPQNILESTNGQGRIDINHNLKDIDISFDGNGVPNFLKFKHFLQTVLCLDGDNQRVGICDDTPLYPLEVSGTARVDTLLIKNSTDNASTRFISALDNSQATNSTKWITWGRENTQGNQAELGFFYAGSNSGDNRMDFGFNGYNLMTLKRNGNLGLGTTNPIYQLELTSNSAAKPTSSSWTISSDERIKENIELADLDICYNNIKQLDLKRYKWKDEFIENHSVEDKHRIGWIAQEVEQIIPKAITTKKNEKYGIDDFKSLDADQIYASMYGCIKKLIEKVEKLETFISQLDIEEQ